MLLAGVASPVRPKLSRGKRKKRKKQPALPHVKGPRHKAHRRRATDWVSDGIRYTRMIKSCDGTAGIGN